VPLFPVNAFEYMRLPRGLPRYVIHWRKFQAGEEK
jgi:hypothetical protein